VVLLDFGFTNCPNICPTTLANLANIHKTLPPEDQKHVQVLFVSVDPERDTPAVLKDYVQFFDSDFIGLTGSADQIATVAKAYGVDYEKSPEPGGPSGYGIQHSTGVFLLERSSLKCVGYYLDRQLSDAQRVAADLRRFINLPAADAATWQAEKMGVVKGFHPSGRQLYLEQCASCHLENGRGVPGKYPSLVQSRCVLGAPNRLVALTLDGVKASDTSYKGVMPAYRTLMVPAYLADVLTYIRQSWGNNASPVSADYVQKLFYQLPPRSDFWTWKALEALPEDKSVGVTKP
jgi:protein SCO1/2